MARIVEQLARLLQAFRDAVFAGLAHPLAQGLRHDDAGDLVVHELGVAEGLQRKHAEQEGNRQRAGPLEEPLQRAPVIKGLGHGDLRAGIDLLPKPVDLVIEVLGRRVHRAGDGEARGPTDGRAQPVVAVVEALENLDQPNGVDVPHAGGGRVVADAGRVTGQRDDVPDAEGMGADQFRLQRHQVLVA